jgi:hypothetical protein
MESWPAHGSNPQDAQPSRGAQLIYSVYADEPGAARAAQLLVEAGFPPDKVHIGVQRDGQLAEAHTGRSQTLGAAMLIGATLTASVGAMLAGSAAAQLSALPLGPAGDAELTASIFALAPAALPGALLGWIVAALRWRAPKPAFPAADSRAGTFVGVEVSQGNRADAELTLRGARACEVSRLDEWRGLARAALSATPEHP